MTGVMWSKDKGVSWNPINNGLPTSLILSLAVDGAKIIVGTNSGEVYSSNDTGKYWNKLGCGLPGTGIYSLVVSEASVFAGVWWHGIFRLNKNDSVWTQCANGIPVDITVECLTLSGSRIFAGTHRGGIFFSDNNGASWDTANIGLPPSATIRAIMPIGGNIFAGSYWQGLFVSSDNGACWTKFVNGIPADLSVGTIAVSGNNIFVGTYDHGVIFSTDMGINWNDFSDGFPLTGYSFAVVALSINSGNIIAGAETYFPSLAEGLWQRPLGSLLSVREDAAPSNFFLNQNYPNPFNPITSVSYSLPQASFVTFKIYNILGEEIATLINEQQAGGIHQLKFDGSQFGSGTYIYRITAGKFAQAKKMVIIK